MAELLDAEVEIVVLVLISTRSEQSETEEDVGKHTPTQATSVPIALRIGTIWLPRSHLNQHLNTGKEVTRAQLSSAHLW